MRFMTTALAVTLVMALHARAQVPSSGEASAARGRQVFEQSKCLLCHSLDGKGGKLSVALDGVAERRDAAAMKRILLSPEKELAGSKAKVKMPVFPFKDGEVDAVVAYLLTLRKPAK
jgi:nitric oxide reductase subunit C